MEHWYILVTSVPDRAKMHTRSVVRSIWARGTRLSRRVSNMNWRTHICHTSAPPTVDDVSCFCIPTYARGLWPHSQGYKYSGKRWEVQLIKPSTLDPSKLRRLVAPVCSSVGHNASNISNSNVVCCLSISLKFLDRSQLIVLHAICAITPDPC